MKKITLHLQAPLMSFGTAESRWDIYKDTKNAPTKSAIVGMIGAAFGYQRNSKEIVDLFNSIEIKIIEDLASMESEEDFFASYNQVIEDYQIMSTKRRDQFCLLESHKGFNRASSGRQRGSNIIRKYYLEDQSFEVEVSAKDELIDDIYEALRHPYYPYYIGRACCIPSSPVVASEIRGE